jgi:hypothetical protein
LEGEVAGQVAAKVVEQRRRGGGADAHVEQKIEPFTVAAWWAMARALAWAKPSRASTRTVASTSRVGSSSPLSAAFRGPDLATTRR